jgi:hypothetical protein
MTHGTNDGRVVGEFGAVVEGRVAWPSGAARFHVAEREAMLEVARNHFMAQCREIEDAWRYLLDPENT